MNLSKTWFNNAWIREALGLPKAELAQCRELSELRLQSEQKLIAERDTLRGQVVMLEMHLENHDDNKVIAEQDEVIAELNRRSLAKDIEIARLRAALEDIANLSKEAGPNTNIWFASGIARRALEGK
jgi:hypothetical protein